ncbi:hypothetical protein V496_00791 [Pseudogymnoascus sp. VKM F-4515 (FW-2607)]|nr:hypothetical protein V496_00791 [Pseudogymnoascus sp. VKM F-4515 (FW-2607)]
MHLSTPLILSLTLLTRSALAGPYPRNAGHDYAGSGFLMPRQCDSYCGYGDAYCCSSGQVCTTDAANVAACVAPTLGSGSGGGGNDGSWNYYTTTIVDAIETTRVITMSSFIGAPAASEPYIAQSTAICYAPLISCGSICCASNQQCWTRGQCKPKEDGDGGGGGGGVTSGPQPTAPVKGTSVIATTVPVTTTQGFVAPVETTGNDAEGATSGSKPGLSGGQIAGIVIGVLAGIIFLLFLCACCCLSAGIKGVWHLIAGKKKDSRRGSRTEITETRRHSTRYGGSNASRRETHGGWFGGAVPSKSGRHDEKHGHKKEAAGLAGLGLGLAALWAGMKFKKDKKEDRRKQSASYYDSYTESYTGTTDSSTSSGGRTRQSRRSRSRR